MRKLNATILTLTIHLILGVTAMAQGIILPGKAHINVEKLKKNIDLNMDLSQLNVCELRVVRNAFAARQGYCFKDATLRGVFSSTTWYNDTMMGRFFREDGGQKLPYHYSKAEMDFINRAKQREEELLKKNFVASNGYQVNLDNLINPFQLDKRPDNLMDKLGRYGFAVSPANYDQLFHIYENNDYRTFPSFITTDLFLQLYHLYFDCVLRDIEQQRLYPALQKLCLLGFEYFDKAQWKQANTNLKAGSKEEFEITDDAEWCKTYFAIALELLKGTAPEYVNFKSYRLNEKYLQLAKEEYLHANSNSDYPSLFLGPDYYNTNFAYSLFRPRGHYMRTKNLEYYFRTMMWLQTIPMAADYVEQMRRAILLAQALETPAIKNAYQTIAEPITYLMGKPDHVTIEQVGIEWNKLGQKLSNKKAVRKVSNIIKVLADKQIRIRPLFQKTSIYKINLMPQRYQPDAEVMLKMVDNKTFPCKREQPNGLDIMASMGWEAAENILLNELQEAQKWKGFTTALQSAKQVMQTVPWEATMTNQWLHILPTLSKTQGMPYFMQSPQWQKKCLNSALASWAELKHDAILYAKQPAGAECGGYGPDDPITKGYVEPNTYFWENAIALLDKTANFFKQYNMYTEKVQNVTERIRENMEFCLKISEKELKGIEPTDEEYDNIKVMGSTVEYISMDLLRQNEEIQDWNDIVGADKKVSIVADIFTSNGDNIENKHVVYAGVGPAYEIYVVVEIGGKLYLTRGAILSYRQLNMPSDLPRLTDEEWQKELESNPNKFVPEWMQEISLPSLNMVKENEEIFYSSGC